VGAGRETPPPPSTADCSGQIFKDDVVGFSSTSDVCFLATTTEYIGVEMNRGNVHVYALPAGEYTATLYVMVKIMKGEGRAPIPSLAWANFSIMTECTLKAAVATLCVLCGNNYRTRARTFKCLLGPGIDPKELIPPAYVAWRSGTKTLFLLGA
jgi:hypothetical protein